MFADWTDRIAKGETPATKPPRPTGAERNLVITQWEWADPREYFHDIIASDKRNPRVNPYGAVYGLHENSSDHMTILDPVKHTWRQVTIPRNPAAPATPNTAGMAAPSPFWGERGHLEHGRDRPQQRDGSEGARVEHDLDAAPRTEMPSYCMEGSGHPSAKIFADGPAGWPRPRRPSVHGVGSDARTSSRSWTRASRRST